MTTTERWWVKRAGDPKGPFPTAVLESNIRQGRVRADDLLSPDGVLWTPGRDVSRFAGLWDEPVLAAGAGVDERAEERRTGGTAAADRSDEDRRMPEDPAVVARRERASRVWSSLRQPPPRASWRPFAVLGALVLGVFLLSTQGTRLGNNDARCSAAPAPELNWEFCNLAGRDLRGQDLSKANLRNAKLVGADLTDTRLEGADLAYADLGGALMVRTNLTSARLAGARLSAAVLSGSDLRGADLSYADFSQAKTGNNQFEGALFVDTVLPSAQPCSDESGRTACARLMEPRTQ